MILFCSSKEISSIIATAATAVTLREWTWSTSNFRGRRLPSAPIITEFLNRMSRSKYPGVDFVSSLLCSRKSRTSNGKSRMEYSSLTPTPMCSKWSCSTFCATLYRTPNVCLIARQPSWWNWWHPWNLWQSFRCASMFKVASSKGMHLRHVTTRVWEGSRRRSWNEVYLVCQPFPLGVCNWSPARLVGWIVLQLVMPSPSLEQLQLMTASPRQPSLRTSEWWSQTTICLVRSSPLPPRLESSPRMSILLLCCVTAAVSRVNRSLCHQYCWLETGGRLCLRGSNILPRFQLVIPHPRGQFRNCRITLPSTVVKWMPPSKMKIPSQDCNHFTMRQRVLSRLLAQ